MNAPTETLPAETLIFVTLPWVEFPREGTIGQLIAELRSEITFSDHAVSQVRAWTGAAPIVVSVGGVYDIRVALV